MNILLTSAGRRGYLVRYFKEILKGNGKVHVGNSDELVTSFIYGDYNIVTPPIYDAGYVSFLIDYCLLHHIYLVIPLFDVDLPILAHHKNEFKNNGIQVVVSDIDTVEICNDKWKFFLFCNKNGFKTPSSYLDLETVKGAVAAGRIFYPLIIKPRWGMGSLSIFEADNERELEVLYEKSRSNIMKTYLKFEAMGNEKNCVIIQEKIIGQEYGLDVINNLNGEYRATIVKMKLAMRSGETDIAKVERHALLEEIGRKLSVILQHIGNLDVDLFLGADKEVYILEMNARFGGGYPFSHTAGVNLPLAILQWSKNKEPDRDLLDIKSERIIYKDITMI